MRPAWQVDTFSTQLKYLEAQKDHLSSLVDQIDSTIHDAKEWINGRKNKTVSFTEMGTFIESTFSDVSTKCLEIYREHQYDPVVSEEDDEASDPQNLVETASGHSYSKRNTDVKQDRSTGKGIMTDDSRKEKVVQKSRRIKTKKCNTTDDSTEHFTTDLNNIKHKLDLFGQDVENVKSNEFENSHKLESLENTLSAFNKLISDMQLKIDLLQKSQHETNAALKELSDFASPLKTDVEILSREVKSTDSKLHSFVDELKNDSEKIKQKLSNSQDQFGLVCQLLSKRMIYMEQLRNILNTTKSFQDEPFKTCRKEAAKAGKAPTKIAEFTKEASEKWRSLTTDMKKPFEASAADDKKRYEQEMAEYNCLTVDRIKINGLTTGYFFFLADYFIRMENKDIEREELLKMVGEEWRALSNEDKKPYEKRALEGSKMYESATTYYRRKTGGGASGPPAKKAKLVVEEEEDEDDDEEEDDEDEEEDDDDEDDDEEEDDADKDDDEEEDDDDEDDDE